jgi:hypothetical protein
MAQKIIDEYLNILIEQKLIIAVAIVGFFHASLFYYIRPGRKSLKGFIKFVLTFGKSDDPKT